MVKLLQRECGGFFKKSHLKFASSFKRICTLSIDSISGKHMGLLFWRWKTQWRIHRWHSKGRRLCHYPHSKIFNRSLLRTKSSTNSPVCYSVSFTIWTQPSFKKKIITEGLLCYHSTVWWWWWLGVGRRGRLSSRILQSNRIINKTCNQLLLQRENLIVRRENQRNVQWDFRRKELLPTRWTWGWWRV